MKTDRFKKIVKIPPEVKVLLKNDYYHFVGPKGEIKHKLHEYLSIDIYSDYLCIFFSGGILKKRERIKISSLLNTTYSLFNNYISGVLNFFHRSLKLDGIDGRAHV